jgi:hypothetical protein
MLVGALLFLLPSLAGPPPGWQRNAPIEAIRAATVLVEVLGPRGRSTGTGFVVADDATVVTAAHVLQGAWLARVRLPSGEFVPVLGVRDLDRGLDVTILAIPPTGITPVGLGDSDSLRIGQRLLAIGCPFGLEVSVADGLLSALPSRDGHRLLQISIPVSPGSSGGPVITEAGEVVGLVVSGMRATGAENVNFALPINYARQRLTTTLAQSPAPLNRVEEAGQPVDLGVTFGHPDREPLAPVNESLALDFGQVDGVETLTRWRRPDGVEFNSRLRVGLALSPTGEVVVERLRETRADLDGEVGRETHRTLFRAGGDNFFSTSVRFRAVNGRARDYGSELQVRSDQYVLSDMSGNTRSGRMPRGILPPALFDVVVAAHRGELPDVLEFLVVDPETERMQIARIAFSGRERRKIPVARPGTSCDGKPKVVKREVEVLLGVRQIGFERRSVAVLARAPYLILEENLKCVRLPRSEPVAATTR